VKFTIRYGTQTEPLTATSLTHALAAPARVGSELLDASDVVLAVRIPADELELTVPTTADGLWVFSSAGLRRAQSEAAMLPAGAAE
jgi:hypothetical protein